VEHECASRTLYGSGNSGHSYRDGYQRDRSDQIGVGHSDDYSATSAASHAALFRRDVHGRWRNARNSGPHPTKSSQRTHGDGDASVNESEISDLIEKIHRLEIEIARLQEQKEASGEALLLANAALQHNQAISNEWRNENIDQRALFMTKIEVQGLLNEEAGNRRALEGRVTVLEKASSTYSGGKSAIDSVWIKAIAIAGLMVTLLGLALHYFGKG
jgi:hypothetical protein